MATTCSEQLLRHLPCRDEEPTPGKHQGFTVGNERKTPSIKILGGDLGSFKRLMQKTSVFLGIFFPVSGKMGGFGSWDGGGKCPSLSRSILYPWKNSRKRPGEFRQVEISSFGSPKMRRIGKNLEKEVLLLEYPKGGI